MKVQFKKLITFRLCYVSENKFLYNSGTTSSFSPYSYKCTGLLPLVAWPAGELVMADYSGSECARCCSAFSDSWEKSESKTRFEKLPPAECPLLGDIRNSRTQDALLTSVRAKVYHLCQRTWRQCVKPSLVALKSLRAELVDSSEIPKGTVQNVLKKRLMVTPYRIQLL
jgi:hypothetical protein